LSSLLWEIKYQKSKSKNVDVNKIELFFFHIFDICFLPLSAFCVLFMLIAPAAASAARPLALTD
jgi:hypothetical protein